MEVDKTRIAILSVHSCPIENPGAKDTGGMSVYIRELARALGEQGLCVDVYTRSHDPEDESIIELGQKARLIHLRAGDDEKIPKLAVYSHLPEFACNLESFRKQNSLQYDLIFSHYWLSGWVGQYLQCWWNIPHIMTFHTLGAIKNAIGIGEDEPELRLEAEGNLARNCHRIIATTGNERNNLVRCYHASPERISVVPCGVNLTLFQPMSKETAKQQLGFGGDKVILFVGRIEPLKGVGQLLRAMGYLQNGQGLKLVIIGGDEESQNEMQRLRRLSCDLQIDSLVTFLGLVEHEQLPRFYSAADVCVIPSYYESFGMVALESLACGTPVVATNVGGLKRVIHQGKTGYVVQDNAPHHLAEKIAQTLSQPSDTKSTLSIRASVSGFSWTNIAQAIIKELRQVVSNYSGFLCRNGEDNDRAG